MREKVLIVEDEFIVANDLRLTLERAGYRVCGIAASVDESLKIIAEQNPGIVLLDIQLRGKLTGIDLAKQLNERNIAFVYLSANSNQSILEAARATQPYGFLVKPFREKDVLISLDIARYRHEHSLESRLRRALLFQKLFEEILVDDFVWDSKMLKIVKTFQTYIPFDYLAIGTKAPGAVPYIGSSFLRIGFDEYQTIGIQDFCVMCKIKMQDLKAMQEVTLPNGAGEWYDEKQFIEKCRENPVKGLMAKTFNLRSNLDIPLILPGGELFSFSFFSRSPAIYNAGHLEMLTNLKQSLEVTANGIINLKNNQPPVDNNIAEPVSQKPHFDGIIGNNHALLGVLDDVTQVAPFDTSVLILGESGTGKERIAYAVHHLSSRKNKPFIKINCAALPANLIESELFGHEKGAFTGATERRTGKFEQASDGTIFLDEIGELPLELQVKLLRVLQEKEIERIGGKSSLNVNVRIIAATNRNLEKEVAEGRFRLDLYYRLNVFPVELPPLRDRKDDIQALALYFANKFCAKMNKGFVGISKQMMAELHAYHWPGNIRELENIMEQSIILSDGKSELTLKRPLMNAQFPIQNTRESGHSKELAIQNFDDVRRIQHQTEREYIISILRKVNGRIRGEGGAAKILMLNPTTLESRISRLGIKKEDYLF